MEVTLALSIEKADLALVDELSRLQLAAKQLGWSFTVRVDDPELVELLGILGLNDELSVEVSGQPEQREQRLGVEEVVMPDDPVA